MTAPLPPPSPLDPAAARWRAVALALAVVCAFLSGLLLLTLHVESASNAALDASTDGPKDASAEEVEVEVEKRGQIEGVIMLSGTPPEMRVPRRRKAAAFCRSKLLPSDAVRVNDGRLKDVLVRIENGGAKGDYSPPDARVVLEQVDCMYAPRIQGAMIGQELEIRSRDPVLHNVHALRDNEAWIGKAQPKGSEPVVQMLDSPGIFKLTCDVHPWERAFLVVSDHPYFAVTDEAGAFAIADVPAGRYTLEAWHPRFGLRRFPVLVSDKPEKVTLSYESTDPEPEINKGELDGQF